MSLRLRIAAVAGLAVALTVIGAAAFTYVSVKKELVDQVDQALVQRSAEFLPRPKGDGKGGTDGRGGYPKTGSSTSASHDYGNKAAYGGAAGYVQYIGSTGKAYGQPGVPPWLPVTPGALEVAREQTGRKFENVTVGDARGGRTRLRVLTVGRYSGAVQIARPLDEVDGAMSRVLTVLIVLGAVGVALAAALGALVARAALAPIARFTARTERLTDEPVVQERLPVTGKDELSRLARSFNTALDALERSVEAQRQLVADAGHELRTPIASLRANIQILEDAARLPPEDRAALQSDILGELDELTALVGDVVELARGGKQSGDTIDDVRLDLIVAAHAERARRRGLDGVSVTVDSEPTLISGDPERIGRAVSNLLDNARKWSPPGAQVEVTLRDGVLVVRDHGPGFEEKDLPRIFERFYRSDSARAMPGSGLGLAIVRQAAEAHGGWVRAGNVEDGGARLEVSFGNAAAPERSGSSAA